MRTCVWIVCLVSAWLLSAGSAPAQDAGPRRVGVLWFAGTLGAECPVDDALVAEEVRRIYRHMGIEIEWTTVREGDVENHGELIVTGVAANPLPRPSVMGSVDRDSNTAWVYCIVIESALGLRSPDPRESPLLSRAVGRVVAHEIAHVLAPRFGHSARGLMRGQWREATLRDDHLVADASTREAVRTRLFAREAAGASESGPAADLTRVDR